MKWPWDRAHELKQQKAALAEDIRQERGAKAEVTVKLENAISDVRTAYGLEDVVRRSIRLMQPGRKKPDEPSA